MAPLLLASVGKYKQDEWTKIESDYLKRIHSPNLSLIEVKSDSDRPEIEGEEIIKKIPPKYSLILLSEEGEAMTSQQFASFLQESLAQSCPMLFALGGASGHGKKIKAMAKKIISLSPMTFPHRLARLVLIEQIYRAQTLRTNHPYHK